MNKANRKHGPVDVPLCLSIIARMITNAIKDPQERASKRLVFMQNLSTVDDIPDRHFAMAMRAIEQGGRSFEAGILLGFTMSLASRRERVVKLASGNDGRKLLKEFLSSLDASPAPAEDPESKDDLRHKPIVEAIKKIQAAREEEPNNQSGAV